MITHSARQDPDKAANFSGERECHLCRYLTSIFTCHRPLINILAERSVKK